MVPPDQPAYHELLFGWAEAEEETAQAPELLLEGFLDMHGAVTKFLRDRPFLVLGYKGSGKTAIAQHLKLLSRSQSDLFVRTVYLSDFPYAEFREIEAASLDATSRYPAIWPWILLLYVAESFSKDEGAAYSHDFDDLAKTLRRAGFLPSSTAPRLMDLTKKNTFSLSAGKIATASTETSSSSASTFTLPPVIERVTQIVCGVETDNDHLILIDGLDDALSATSDRLEPLAALLLAVYRLNLDFAAGGSACKIALLCRTDLYERLPGANKNKIRQDAAIHLDWYTHTREPKNSNLVQLVNLKVQASHPQVKDVFTTYFPPELRRRPTLQALLDVTRHTPRDLLQLLKTIQLFSNGREQLSTKQILNGIRRYSNEYFLPEIRDELDGYMSSDEIHLGVALLASLGRPRFEAPTLLEQTAKDPRFAEFDVNSFLDLLFECSALGNVRERDSKGSAYYTFKYRNRHMGLNFGETMVVHQGLWPALNYGGDEVRRVVLELTRDDDGEV